MAAVDEVIQKLDECVTAAKALFEQEFSAMMRARVRGREGPIAFSHGTKLTQRCISCGREVVDYAIFGRWIEGTQEGEANITWKCGTCKKTFVLRGQRNVIIRQLIVTYRPKAA